MNDIVNFFSKYSFLEITIFIAALVLAIKGGVEFYKWIKNILLDWYNNKYNKDTEKKFLEDQLIKEKNDIEHIKSEQQMLKQSIADIKASVDLLIDSDKDDIKSFLTKEHHYYCYIQGWIDDHSYECCLKRYSHYKKEGGNSFIDEFMEELKELPKQPPHKDGEIK